MHYVERVEIEGFWGTKQVKLNFDPEVNFLIGVNGSGKTTAINLIAAALNADFSTLDTLPFKKISITLAAFQGRTKPSIEIVKAPMKSMPYSAISYRVRETANSKPKTYSLDALESQRAWRAREVPPHYMREYFYRVTRGLDEQLHRIARVSWLSIHRSAPPLTWRASEEKSYESTIDRKIVGLTNELVRFFSQLTKTSDREVQRFQEFIFLSLLHEQSEEELFLFMKRTDLEEMRMALIEIFRQLKIKETTFSARIQRFFQATERTLKKLEGTERLKLTTSDLTNVIANWRIDAVVKEWRNLVKKQSEIFEPRDTFLDVINGMFQRKELIINEQNEISVKTQSGKTLSPKDLSSGEKQLLIFLGEALLQQKAPWIYIADEPELSLHVRWQEMLIESLRRINPSSQIIFATHSPDIVSFYGDRVIDMEGAIES